MKHTIEYLEHAIELFVMLQYKLIPFDCNTCNEQTQDMMKCMFVDNEYSDEPVYYDPMTDKEYFSCPISMIPRCVFEWYDQYTFIKEFNTPMHQKSTSSMFWWFVKTYNRFTSEITKKMEDNNKPQY